MTALHGIFQLEVTESIPDLLSGTIGENRNLGVRLTPNQQVGVTLMGTSEEIHRWLDRIHMLLNARAREDRVEEYAKLRKTTLDIEGVDIGPIQDPPGPIFDGPIIFNERDRVTSSMQTVLWQQSATAAQIRPHLESWVPQMSDAELAVLFEDWTTDGRHDTFAAHLNEMYEPGPTSADLVHAEHDEALGSVFGVDDMEPF